MANHPFPEGTVDWSGDNPGIYLKDVADGPFISLMVWFRIALSPFGKGHVLVLFEDTTRAGAWIELVNFCKKFGVFREAKAFSALEYLPMQQQMASGDNVSSSAVTVTAAGLKVELIWDKLGKPFAADVLPEQSATGAHEMYSVFVESADASIVVNGRRLRGRPFPRPFMGRSASSAFLAFSETWLKA